MIGLDTNVLLRSIVEDDEVQTALARKALGAHCSKDDPGYIDLVVLAELLWVLLSYYKYSRVQIATMVEKLLETREFLFENESLVFQALSIFVDTKADFSDILIALKSERAGCTQTLTFDRRAARDAGMTLIG